MNKKIKVSFFINAVGHHDIVSNLLYDDVDMLQFLLLQLNNINIIDKILRLISSHYKVTSLIDMEIYPNKTLEEDFVLLVAPILEDEKGIPKKYIKLEKLKNILQDWKQFLKNNKEFEKEY